MKRKEQKKEARQQGAALSPEGGIVQLPPSHACRLLLMFAGAIKEFALRVGPVGGGGRLEGIPFKDYFLTNYMVCIVKS